MAAKRSVPPHDEDIRYELVARIRRQIQNGTYESREKLETALARMFESAGITGQPDRRGPRFDPSSN